MNLNSPNRNQQKQIMHEVDCFYWENFKHRPLNVFDIGGWTLAFSGDIEWSRTTFDSDFFANYSFDIKDLNTCPRSVGQEGLGERWNEDSLTVSWLLGRDKWPCMVRSDRCNLVAGNYKVTIAVSRFQNMPSVEDLRNPQDLSSAISRIAVLGKKNFDESLSGLPQCFSREIHKNEWQICPSTNGLGDPEYIAALAIDNQTSVTLFFTIDNAWFDDEPLPANIEAKYLESIWDFLSQVTLTPSSKETKVGTIDRTPEGEAPKIQKAPSW